MTKKIHKKNHPVSQAQDKTQFLSDGSQKNTLQDDSVTNMEEITQMGLEVWQDGFFDKYHLLPGIYKAAAAFFITLGVLAIVASFLLFHVMEPTPGSTDQIKGIFSLVGGLLFILSSAFAHYFQIRNIKGACGSDEEMRELAEKKLRREKLLAPYRKMRAAEKLREHKAKKKHRSKHQKESHQSQNAEAIGATENNVKSIPENKKRSEKEENKQDNKKESEKDKPIPSKDGTINSDAFFIPPAPSTPPASPSSFSMPTTVSHKMKNTGLTNDIQKDMPVFSSKASSDIQARGAALAGLFRPNKNLLLEREKPSSSKELSQR